MPHEIMGKIHEQDLGSGYHWTYWAVVVVVIVAIALIAWRVYSGRGRPRD